MEREWKLGVDLSTQDSLLDGLTFDDIILAVRCNCQTVTPPGVRKQLREIMDGRLQDMNFLLENNMAAIMAAATEGRE